MDKLLKDLEYRISEDLSICEAGDLKTMYMSDSVLLMTCIIMFGGVPRQVAIEIRV